jgi:membrane protein
MQLLYAFLKIFLYSLQRFFAEKRLLWAASLTYTTIFSLIPLLSVLFFVFNIFGSLAEIKNMVQPYIYKTLAPWAQEKVINILNELVNNINFSTIGFFSASLLIISVFLLLFEIEYALNEIWLIQIKPSTLSRAAIYWALLTIGPVLIALSLFIFVTLQAYIPLKVIETYVSSHGVGLLSYILIWSAFTSIYFFMPGTSVSFASALFGGVFAATLWKVSGIAFSMYTSRFFFYYPKIFGSLAAIPLFLLWIFLCWLLFLFGAELTFMHQNRFFYSNSYKTPAVKGDMREYYALIVFLFIAKEFHRQAKPIPLRKIAIELKIPHHIVHELMESVIRYGMLVESLHPKSCFMPGKPLDKMILAEVRTAIHQIAAIPEYTNITKTDPLHKAACYILDASAPDTDTKTVQEIMPLLS